jgi:calcineurin-like phosphoesterase family protein
MSRNLWIISDTHFGHQNILYFKRKDGSPVRAFDSVDNMDQHMIDNWNRVVKDVDVVYHLGDVFFGDQNGTRVLSQLKGRKRLILGNHDDGKNKALQKYFQKIMMWRMFPELGCILSHVPLHESTFIYKSDNMINIHGHIHNNDSPSPKHKNVSVEVINYTPVNIEDLVKK